MMEYNPNEAFLYVKKAILADKRFQKMPKEWIDRMLISAFEIESDYVRSLGEEYYDEDEIFERIVDALADDLETEMDVAELVDLFIESLFEYLEKNHQIDWD